MSLAALPTQSAEPSRSCMKKTEGTGQSCFKRARSTIIDGVSGRNTCMSKLLRGRMTLQEARQGLLNEIEEVIGWVKVRKDSWVFKDPELDLTEMYYMYALARQFIIEQKL